MGADAARLSVTLHAMGLALATLEPRVGGDLGIRFANTDDLGRFVSDALQLLSGDEIVRLGGGCLVTLSREAATLLCDRAQ